MNFHRQHQTTTETNREEAEVVSHLLLELEDALAAAMQSADSTSVLACQWQTRISSTRERLERMATLHAPWLHLGRSPLRWLVCPLNLLISPWARKQAAFNSDVLQALQALTQITEEALAASDAITRLEARSARLESLMRELLALKLKTGP